MSPSALDRESFHDILAAAFVAQQSLLDAQSRSGIKELLRSLRAGDVEFREGMRRIADRTREVANATGVAIGLQERGELVYLAGSGSAATYTGRHVVATLSASGYRDARREILRVENAETEAGIRVAICRQFGANSLIIFPIYQAGVVAGVLEIFFTEAHTFDDDEVYTYQFMANTIEKAMCVQGKQKQSFIAAPSTNVDLTAPQLRRFSGNCEVPADKDAIRPSRTGIAYIENPPTTSTPLAEAVMIGGDRSHLHMWRLVDRAAVIAVLVSATWIAFTSRYRPLPSGVAAEQRSASIEQQVSSAANVVPVTNDVLRFQSSASSIGEGRKAEKSRPRRQRVGDDEVDYISEDVTVRHLGPTHSLRHERIGDYEVDYISEDVTVRHFFPKPAVLPVKSNAQVFRP